MIDFCLVTTSPTPWALTILVLAAAYLLGSIPSGYLLVRFLRSEDIRETGSGNIGATNVARAGGKGLGLLTLSCDLGKGLLAVLLARYVFPANLDIAVLAGVAAIVGHVFPVWLRFHGGKGVATGLGVFLAIAPLASLCVLAVFLLIFVLTRFVSLASIVAAGTFPIFAYVFARNVTPVVLAGFVAIPLLIIAKHHENIRRLLSGTESRFSSRKVEA